MRTLIKVIMAPFVVIGAVLGVVYTIVDFTWFTAKGISTDIAKYMADKQL